MSELLTHHTELVAQVSTRTRLIVRYERSRINSKSVTFYTQSMNN